MKAFKNTISTGLALLVTTCMIILMTNQKLITEQYFVLAVTMSVASVLFLAINKKVA